jgi:hypothetical protein
MVKTSVKPSKKLTDRQVPIFYNQGLGLLVVNGIPDYPEAEKPPFPPSGNSETFHLKLSRNTNDQRSSIHWDGQKVSNSMKDTMMMLKEATMSTALQILQFQSAKNRRNHTLLMSSR